MACFTVPAAEALITTIMEKSAAAKEKKETADALTETVVAEKPAKIPFSRKLKWLTNLLWGGSALLAFEHVWHGEVVPYFPFLTAAENAESAAEMLQEMATVGVTMALLVTAVWLGMLAVTHIWEKRAEKETAPAADAE